MKRWRLPSRAASVTLRPRKDQRLEIDWPAQLAAQCTMVGLPAPLREHRFHPTRFWRFDLAWPEARVAVEVDGGIYTTGRHARGAGIEDAMEKFAEAACLGWRVMAVSPRQVRSGAALKWIERCLASAADQASRQTPPSM